MRLQQDVQVAVRERLRRLLTSHYDTAPHEVRLTVDWINSQAQLRAVLDQAERAEPDLDHPNFELSLSRGRGSVSWPSQTPDGRAVLIWHLMQSIATADRQGIGEQWVLTYVTEVAFGEPDVTDAWRQFTERVLEPLFSYLIEHIGAQSSVLHVLGRYIRCLEWFDRDMLYELAMADTRKTEEVYDLHLRRFLFDEGIDMPFSQARSASGESDILSDLDSADPLVCELKVFDAKDRDKRHIASGLHQAVHYAEDYGKNTSYLVIVNVSGRPLELPSDGDPKLKPYYLDVAGVRVNLLTVRARPMPTASKLGRPSPVVFSRSDFVDPDA
ncbi:hypothetical protein [Catellatospora citrea]|uniref:Uncharacterized protein n=1 Tax=Catellatospora citrea TaxID=53366 RepID=A0A8J3KE96_9ACTN|nr:hypothetical protein [Catellatospora citrea]RKE10491.1 hypothetical protein C8E86_5394 [Catellatospora citrea]GIF98999.1 hypothetical protein Cci01nite_40930 [Catellatospora citrea]